MDGAAPEDLDDDLAASVDADLIRHYLQDAASRCESLPTELLVDVALSATVGVPELATAAMSAVLRRVAMAEADGLIVANRPHRSAFGAYTVRRRGEHERPYATVLQHIDPLVGSCGCADFVRGSLGLCKHLVAVAIDLHRRPVRLARARVEQEANPVWRLAHWDPVRPWSGEGDWLERVMLAPEASRRRSCAGLIDRSTGLVRARALRELPIRARVVDTITRIARADAWDPALLVLLERERERLAAKRDGAVLARQLRSRLRSLRRTPYPFQIEGVRRFLRSGRMLLADDMGLGKTTQAVAASHVLFDAGRVERGLVIAPASLKLQWAREWDRISGVPIRVVEGRREERAALYRERSPGFLVLNYEQLLRDVDLAIDYAPDMVVLDEAQRIKNWETKTAAAVKQLTPTYRLVLTGTPLENRLDELASIYDWVDDLALEPKWRLGPWHTFDETDADGGHRGVRNLDTLRARIAPTLTRRIRREVLSELPARTDTRVPVVATAPQMAAHAELDRPIARLATILRSRGLRKEEFNRLMSLLAAQRMICNGMALAEFTSTWPTCESTPPSDALCDEMSSPKLGELRRLVAELAVEQGRKVVVFSQWRRMLQLGAWATSDILGNAGLRLAFFTGAETQKARDLSVQRFHDDRDLRVLFLTDAGGVGLNLQRAATACINLELPWNPAVLEQRIGRIHRLGQDQPIDVFNVVSESGIEARIAGLVADKRQVFDALFDGSSDRVSFASSARFAEKIAELVDLDAAGGDGDDHSVAAASDLERRLSVASEEDDIGSPQGDAVPLAPAVVRQAPPAAAERGHVAPRAVAAFEPISVVRTSTGIAIHAPPEIADLLATVFEKLGQALRTGGSD